jgi:hypothetical protein
LDSGCSAYEYGVEPGDPNTAAANRLRILRNTVNGAHVNPTYDGRSRVTRITAYAIETVDNGGGVFTDVRTDGNDRSYTYFDCVSASWAITTMGWAVLQSVTSTPTGKRTRKPTCR